MATNNISFYANQSDAQYVLNWIIATGEIGFVLAAGEGFWKAHRTLNLSEVVNRKIWLWHCPSGPLALLQEYGRPALEVDDPWGGWRELRSGADPSQPYFGPAPQNAFLLSLSPTSKYLVTEMTRQRVPAPAGLRVLGRSDFQFPGKSSKAPKPALGFWKRLEKFMFITGVPVDPLGWIKPEKDPTPASIQNDYDWVALPGALAEMRAGVPWVPNPD